MNDNTARPTIDPDDIEEGHNADCYTGGDLPCDDCAYYWQTGG